MPRKNFNISSKLFILLVFTGIGKYAIAQDSVTTTLKVRQDSITTLLKVRNNIYATVQYAGSIGYLSFGAGITNKRQNLHNELLYGFVPSQYGGPLNKFTYKLSYYPFKIRLKNQAAIYPFNPSFFLAYDVGRNFTLVPSYKKYDTDYYWWSSALRRHVGFNIAYERKLRVPNTTKILCYFEVNTNDLYALTLYDNIGEMPFTSIWSFGLGAKVFFR